MLGILNRSFGRRLYPLRLNGLFATMLLASGAVASSGATSSGSHVDPDGRRSLADSVRLSADSGEYPNVLRTTLTEAELATTMPISVALKMRNFKELQARIAAGEQVSWAEMEARYRPLKSDYGAVAQWLEAQGFEITFEDSMHTNLFVRASVARIAVAFGVQMARIATADGEYTTAISAPGIPAAIAESVLSVNGLQPQMRLRHVKSISVNASATPADVLGSSAFVTPNNMAAAYHVPGNLDGTGQTIAIIDGIAAKTADLTSFWAQAGVAQKASNVAVILVDGSSDPNGGNPIESAADVEWAGALAPGAKIRQYISADPLTALSAIFNDLPANPTMTILSSSYGGPEAGFPPSQILSYSQSLAQLAAAGVSIFASSGDGGTNSLDGSYGSYSPAAPVQVDYPASDVDVTGVGGTQLAFDADFNVTGETAWSDLTTTQCATGGGLSTLFPKPSWQNAGPVLSGQSARCVPDVAAISVALAPSGGIPQANGTSVTGEFMALTVINGGNYGFAGTSLATPIWAAFGALLNQARATAGHGPIGLLNPNLYPLVGTPVFTDITSGTNGLYSAGPGYDLCTGLGSPNVTAFIAALTPATPLTTSFSPTIPTVSASMLAPISPVAGGSAVTMGVDGVVSSLGPATYQWTLNGADIIGATGATYAIASVRGNDRGVYAVQVTNFIGTDTVAIGTLTVLAPTATITAAAPSAVVLGSTWTMSVDATSSGGPLTYQWTFNGVDIPGAVQSDFTVADINADDAGDYSVSITDSNGLTVVDLGYLVLNGPDYLTPYSFTTFVAAGSGKAVAVDGAGNLYVADGSSIRKVTPAGVSTTLAGSEDVNGSVDGVGSVATFGYPAGLCVDAGGTVYVADTQNSTIRAITPDGIVSTLAGTAGVVGNADGTGAAAQFRFPQGIAAAKDGDLYVADSGNSLIRVIHPGGRVATFAGGINGNADGVGTTAQFAQPGGIAVDATGTIYVADTYNFAIRKISPAGSVTTLAGHASTPGSPTNVAGSTDGTGSVALFGNPQGIAVGPDSSVYVADTYTQTIRKVAPSGLVTTLAGVPFVNGLSDGTGNQALFNNPSGLALDASGVLYVADASNGAIRAGESAATTGPFVGSQPRSQTIADGTTVILGVSAAGAGSYQWSLNGAPVPGATQPTLIIPGAAIANAGSYICTLTNAQGSVTTAPALLTVVSTADPGRLINLSCRAQVGTGANALIVGYAIGGSGTEGTEPVLIRASGPALTLLGVSGVLPDPSLLLYHSGVMIDSNNGWAGSASLASLFSQVGAFAWTDTSSLDSALSESLTGGPYSAVVTGAIGDTGVALAEIYDATPTGAYATNIPSLVNLSARVEVGIEANILIAGFVIGGTTSKTVLIRASGPALAPFGITGTLPDPKIRLNNGTATIATNEGWNADPQIEAAAASVGAGFRPASHAPAGRLHCRGLWRELRHRSSTRRDLRGAVRPFLGQKCPPHAFALKILTSSGSRAVRGRLRWRVLFGGKFIGVSALILRGPFSHPLAQSRERM
jgi:kumamolisin